jgi:hypothetical protein
MGSSGYVHLENCYVVRRTDKALLVEYEDEEYWLPISQVSEGDKYEEGDGKRDGVTISISEWIAIEKGIEVE